MDPVSKRQSYPLSEVRIHVESVPKYEPFGEKPHTMPELMEASDTVRYLYGTGTGRFWAFSTLANLKLDLLIIPKGLVGRVNVRPVDEKIFSAFIRNDEAKTLLRVEPLYCTCSHLMFSTQDP
jgi:hypothetical protein